MSTPEDRLAALGLVIPEPMQLPPGATLPFPWVRIVGNRAIISGHGPTNPDGSLAQPLGKVGTEVTEEQAYVAARLTGLAILGSLKRELGSLCYMVVNRSKSGYVYVCWKHCKNESCEKRGFSVKYRASYKI